MKIETTSKVHVYEENGTETTVGKDLSITVESHWVRTNMVVIKIGKKDPGEQHTGRG